jgi:hypothetical protein
MTAMGSVFRKFGRRVAGWWQVPGPLEDDSLRGALGWPRDYCLAEERDRYVPPPCRDCGSENIQVEWVSLLDWVVRGRSTVYIRGRLTCRDCGRLQPPPD